MQLKPARALKRQIVYQTPAPFVDATQARKGIETNLSGATVVESPMQLKPARALKHLMPYGVNGAKRMQLKPARALKHDDDGKEVDGK